MTFDYAKYEAACRAAATAQGLDPLTAAVAARQAELDSAGVRYSVEQTGGFTMVATFYGRGEAITCTDEGSWMVCAQPEQDWIDGEYDDRHVTDLTQPSLTPAGIVMLVLARAQ